MAVASDGPFIYVRVKNILFREATESHAVGRLTNTLSPTVSVVHLLEIVVDVNEARDGSHVAVGMPFATSIASNGVV